MSATSIKASHHSGRMDWRLEKVSAFIFTTCTLYLISYIFFAIISAPEEGTMPLLIADIITDIISKNITIVLIFSIFTISSLRGKAIIDDYIHIKKLKSIVSLAHSTISLTFLLSALIAIFFYRTTLSVVPSTF